MKKSFFSHCNIIIPSSQKNRALSLILTSSLTYRFANEADNNTFKIEISPKQALKYKNLFKNYKIDFEIINSNGYLSELFSLKKRIGILIGIVFTMTMLLISSNVVWQINIIGNKNASREEILSELKMAGLSLGTFIPSIDYDILHNRVLLNSKHLSWISINIIGNIATINVREKKEELSNNTPTYSNIVASSDGYIEKITVKNGKKEVRVGQVVKKGEILISGIIDSASEGVRYEQADGEIYAYVNKKVSIKIPYKSTVKEYTGNKYINKSYKIYNFPINFSTKYGNQSQFYDKIEKKEYASIFGVENIPIETLVTTFYEYELKEVVLTKQEAVDKAFLELRAQMDSALQNAELINKTVITSFDEEGFYINCELYCLENIAKIQEFYVSK